MSELGRPHGRSGRSLPKVIWLATHDPNQMSLPDPAAPPQAGQPVHQPHLPGVAWPLRPPWLSPGMSTVLLYQGDGQSPAGRAARSPRCGAASQGGHRNRASASVSSSLWQEALGDAACVCVCLSAHSHTGSLTALGLFVRLHVSASLPILHLS